MIPFGISEPLFHSKSISISVTIPTDELNAIERLLFLANVTYKKSEELSTTIDLKLIIHTKKEVDRVIIELKKYYGNTKYLNNDYIKTYKDFLEN